MSKIRDDIIWAAGILDGEGWFGIPKNRYPKIQLKMTDKDIIKRMANLWKCNITIDTPSHNIRYKQQYVATAYGSTAIQWMMSIYPQMGIRRKKKIRNIIAKWKKVILQKEHNLSGFDKLTNTAFCSACGYRVSLRRTRGYTCTGWKFRGRKCHPSDKCQGEEKAKKWIAEQLK